MEQTTEVKGIATSIRDEDGWIVVRYHNTDVVKFNADKVILNSGGWQTVTTKVRMNQAANQFGLGYYVYQKNHIWYVNTQTVGPNFQLTRFFEDGMEIAR